MRHFRLRLVPPEQPVEEEIVQLLIDTFDGGADGRTVIHTVTLDDFAEQLEAHGVPIGSFTAVGVELLKAHYSKQGPQRRLFESIALAAASFARDRGPGSNRGA